ncbi:MAG TPA: carbamoyl-phosphate synthase large subunit, partial [Clostridiales bacterium]|nr:carbamoyl-phosphate synthase large subunit [Clostridiales bacterium]
LASKATGYPIAKVATKIALGYTLDEITNDVTGETCACFEPALDYVVVKYPKWPFDKFVYADKSLGTQMMATGEVMAIGQSFEEALMKAVRSIELGLDTMDLPALAECTDEEIRAKLHVCDSDRSFVVFEAIKRGISFDEIYAVTKIDHWFLHKLAKLADTEKRLAAGEMSMELYKLAKRQGFTDKAIERLSGCDVPARLRAGFKMVDTCAAEFAARTPYFYSSFDEENEAAQFIEEHPTDKKKVLVFGSGPIRIGQGIEFDYCSVHCVWTLKKHGCEAILVNNNPETVSTDFDTGDRLYFDPLTPESVDNIIATEKPDGCVVQFGGQTAIKLAKALTEMGVRILGTSSDGVDAAEDRERFDEILNQCGIPRAKGKTVFTTEEALAAAGEIGYPVLVRPSYVLGGQGMEIAYNERNIRDFMRIINQTVQEHPILVDKYLMGREVEVDGVFDGEDVLIPGVMEHVERAGVHSGDSISVYPTIHVEDKHKKVIEEYTWKLAKALGVIGLINIQFIIYNDEVYVIEVNPRSSRTIPYISKVTGVPIIDLATKVMMGEKLKDLGYGTGIYREADYYAVKMPVFSFEKLTDVDTGLGPEMKSTGEVLGLAESFPQALLKAFKGANMRVPKKGGRIIITVKDEDKPEMVEIARGFADMGVELLATDGTCKALQEAGVPCTRVARVSEAHPNISDMIASGTIDLVINTPTKGRKQDTDGFKIRRATVEHSVGCATALDTARAMLTVREHGRSEDLRPIDITTI